MSRGIGPVEVVGGVLVFGFLGYNLYSGLATGVLYHKRGRVHRDESPIGFWLLYCLYAAVFCFGTYGMVQASMGRR